MKVRTAHHTPPTFALVGCTSSGKSTLACLLAGRFLLPNEQLESPRIAVEFHNIRSRNDLANDARLRERIRKERLDLSSQSIRSTIKLKATFARHRPLAWWERLFPNRGRLPMGTLVRDLPGFAFAGDTDAIQRIHSGIKDAEILLLFDAAETNHRKEKELAELIFRLAGSRNETIPIRVILNRIDELRSSRQALDSEERRIEQLRALSVQLSIQHFPNARSAAPIYPLAALPALAAVCLGPARRCTSEDDVVFFRETAARFIGRLLPEQSDDYPIHHHKWTDRHFRQYITTAIDVSGWKALQRDLVSLQATRVEVRRSAGKSRLADTR